MVNVDCFCGYACGFTLPPFSIVFITSTRPQNKAQSAHTRRAHTHTPPDTLTTLAPHTHHTHPSTLTTLAPQHSLAPHTHILAAHIRTRTHSPCEDPRILGNYRKRSMQHTCSRHAAWDPHSSSTRLTTLPPDVPFEPTLYTPARNESHSELTLEPTLASHTHTLTSHTHRVQGYARVCTGTVGAQSAQILTPPFTHPRRTSPTLVTCERPGLF